MKGGPPRKPLVITSLPLKKFIEAYEARPALWNVRDSHYTKKDIKIAAYDELIPFLKEIDANSCTREHVKKKINILRSNYRKELRKIEDAKEAGKFYQPTVWTFHALSFIEGSGDLSEPDTPPKIKKIAKKEPVEPPRKLKKEPVEEQDYSDEEEEEDDVDDNYDPVSPASSTDSQPAIIPRTSSTVALPIGNSRTSSTVALPERKLKSEFENSSENDIPFIAKAWGQRLLNLEPRQRVFAEKAISDVLFEASLGTLHRHSVKINEDMSSDDNASLSKRKRASEKKTESKEGLRTSLFDST